LKRLSKFKILLHLLGWILFFIAPVLLSPGPVWFSLTFENVVSLLVRNGTLIVLFYFNLFYLTPFVLKKKGVVLFFSILIILILLVSFFNAGFHQYFVEGRGLGMRPPPPGDRPPFGPMRNHPPMMFASTTFSSLLITLIVVGLSSLLVLLDDWSKAQAEKQEQQLQKIAAELTALKLQISPHFLFNTLNNIRWLVRSKSERAEDAVVKLSHLLRYILYQAEAEQVDLEKEINHLIDFIELQKMRLVNHDSFLFSIEGDLTGKNIVPLLLLPLVENFFKHGDFTGSFQNRISISVAEHQLLFKSENRIALSDEKQNGIGLNNVKRRLALHYQDRHVLKYSSKDSMYYQELELILGQL
jgi:Histidine kinase